MPSPPGRPRPCGPQRAKAARALWALCCSLASEQSACIRAAELPEEEPHSPGEHTLEGFMSACQSPGSSVFRMPPLGDNCRAGCAVIEIERSIHLAEAAGRSVVELPRRAHADAQVDDLFDLPQRIPVRADRQRACDFVASTTRGYYCRPMFNLGSYCKTTLESRREVFMDTLRGYLRPEVLGACEEPLDDEVTLHIRTGDVAQINSGAHGQPPCSFYEEVLRAGNGGGAFRRARLVYAPAKGSAAGLGRTQSACVEQILRGRRLGEDVFVPGMDSKGVQRGGGSMVESFCHLLKARSLALPPSNFNLVPKMMNSALERLFYWRPSLEVEEPRLVPTIVHDHDFDHASVCQVFPQSIQFRLVSDTLLQQNTFGWAQMCWCHGQSQRPWSEKLHQGLLRFFRECPVNMLKQVNCGELQVSGGGAAILAA